MVDANKHNAIDKAINEVESKTNINNRLEYVFSQKLLMAKYVNQIMFYVYYVVFALLALSLYLNRESYNLIVIILLLLMFGFLPFIIGFITRFAYHRFLDLAHLFHSGNVMYVQDV
jgi:hypothetical protein